MQWQGNEFELDGTVFVTLGERDLTDYKATMALGWMVHSTPERFVMLKTRPMIDRYVRLLRDLAPRNVVEIGIWEGGSTVMMALLAPLERLDAIEWQVGRCEALDVFLERRGMSDRVMCHYDFDQADDERLRSLGDAPLDLVVDDASHQLGPTRTSFDVLFPRLRRGGLYIIEDWWYGAVRSGDPDLDARLDTLGEPLANMITQLVLDSAVVPDYIARVDATREMVIIERG